MGTDGTATVDSLAGSGAATLHERRRHRLWEAMERQGVAALAVYGRGSLGSYGPLHFLTGCFAAPKGGFGLIELGRPPVLVAGSEIEAGLLEAGARAAGVEVRRGPHPSAAASTGALLAAAAGDGAVGLASPSGASPPASWRCCAAPPRGPRSATSAPPSRRSAPTSIPRTCGCWKTPSPVPRRRSRASRPASRSA